MIDPVPGWFKTTQYNNKYSTKNVDLVETTWLPRYPWPKEIMYD